MMQFEGRNCRVEAIKQIEHWNEIAFASGFICSPVLDLIKK
jgi:hypothetical protein